MTEEPDDAAMANLRRRMDRDRSEVDGRSWGKDRTQRADAKEDASDDGSDKHRLSKDTRVCCNHCDRALHLHGHEVRGLEERGSGKQHGNPPRHAIELEPNLAFVVLTYE